MWLWATFLVVISCIRLTMNNYQANVNTNPYKISLFFTIRQFLYRLFLLSSIIPIFQSLLIIALIITNPMVCGMKREAWTWYLPSHLVPAKILCSRSEPCTKWTMLSTWLQVIMCSGPQHAQKGKWNWKFKLTWENVFRLVLVSFSTIVQK